MEEKKLSLGESVAGLDKAQLFSVGALFLLGVLSIFSAGAGFEGRGAGFATRQLLWGAVSIAAFLLTLKIGYEKFLREAYLLYGLSLVLLLSVMALGLTVKGSQRWIDLGFFRLQPTEFVKITLVLVLAKHLCRYPPLNFLSFLGGLAVPALSGILVLIQPDAGSAIVYGVISFVAIVVAGAPWRYPAGLLAIFTSLLPFAWRFLREYQKMRIRVFLDPWIDPLGAGYNVIQSRI
ncbi:MAG TPA: FtsW/RodA/SpoVE family cell cycle protein, partial [Synergistales bacterium]|nr:FtsW/RodA/SpoVE family cell cycle protein [Synergistales bacterium]